MREIIPDSKTPRRAAMPTSAKSERELLPGMPCTQEELEAIIDRAEENIRAGRVVPHSQVMRETAALIASWRK